VSRTLISQWRHLKTEVWDKLERRKSGKLEMYIELYRFAADELKLSEEVDAYSDPHLARTLLRRISANDVDSEKRCIKLVEGFRRVLRDEFKKEPELSQGYLELLSDFLKHRNLRYKVTDAGNLVLSISGLLADQYDYLKRAVADTGHIRQILDELEDTATIDRKDKANNFIRVASNMMEGIAIQRAGAGTSLSGAVSALKNGSCFPHDAVADALREIYKFASDYPNIRHSGNPAGKKRNLKCDDAVLMIGLAIAYAAFLCNELDIGCVLTGSSR